MTQHNLYFKIPLQAELSFEQLGDFIKSLPQELKALLFEVLKKELLAQNETPQPQTKEQKLQGLLAASVWTDEEVKIFEENQNYMNQWKVQTF